MGKTSLSCSIAYELAKKAKTILVDVDPQGNSSSWLLAEAPEFELADVLQGKCELTQAIVQAGPLSIIPTFGIDGELKNYGESKLADEPFVFCDLVEELAKLKYKYAIFDLSPGFGRLEKAAIIAADEVITPMTPDAFSLDGIEIFSNELRKLIKAFRRNPSHRKIVVNGYDDRIKQHNEILPKALAAQGFDKFIVAVDPVFRKAQAAHLPIQEVKGGDKAKAETLKAIKDIAEAI